MNNQTFLYIAIILCIALLCIEYMHVNDTIPSPPLKISIREAKARRFGLILDVRTSEQRSRLGYYPNSIPIALETLSRDISFDMPNKKTWILVYSNGDEKARWAAEQLFEMGYYHVRYIDGTYLALMPGRE
jgi:rhodanese-related sulfurtransferase